MRTNAFAAALAAAALLAACSKPEPAAGAPTPEAVAVDSAKTVDSTAVDSAKMTVDSTAMPPVMTDSTMTADSAKTN